MGPKNSANLKLFLTYSAFSSPTWFQEKVKLILKAPQAQKLILTIDSFQHLKNGASRARVVPCEGFLFEHKIADESN